ncbi:MAG: hypothetical protein QOK48_2610 [Blastocatellia bacterium]|nr:hypothetical protein [Blastocatellia bacterium]
MKGILFVDDEVKVLEGLERMLHTMRREWEMSFAEGGPAALETLSKRHFDVVVTDMRMPGMDGAQLLDEIRRLHPDTVRIVLSGHSDRALIMKSVGTAHQFISKPCEPQVIKETVRRACALRDLLAQPKLQLLVSQMESLPSPPTLFVELMKEIDSAGAGIRRISEIVSQDPGMTAKILQMVNSAFFGLRRHISTPGEAVNLLGLDIVRAMALSVKIFSAFDYARVPGFPTEKIWSRCLAVGTLAKAIARSEHVNAQIADQAFTAGLLHDTGSLVLAATLPQQFSEMLLLAQTEKISQIEAEQKVFGAVHPEVGGYLLGLWGLPDAIVEAVAFHHSPGLCSTVPFNALTGVHVADFLTPTAVAVTPSPLDTEYLTNLGVMNHIQAWEDLSGRQPAE